MTKTRLFPRNNADVGEQEETGQLYAGFCPTGEPVCAVISLGLPLPTGSSGLPEDSASSVNVFCLALLRARFTWPPVSPRAPVVSYTTLSPLPCSASRIRRSTLCCTFSRVAPGGRYPPLCSVQPGRSSAQMPKHRDATARWPVSRSFYRSRGNSRVSTRVARSD